jgi:hypothetical protein
MESTVGEECISGKAQNRSRDVDATAYRSRMATLPEYEQALRQQLDKMGPAPRAQLLHTLMLPDFNRAEHIAELWMSPKIRSLAELAIDAEGTGWYARSSSGCCASGSGTLRWRRVHAARPGDASAPAALRCAESTPGPAIRQARCSPSMNRSASWTLGRTPLLS